MTRDYLYHLTYELNAAALEVHKFLGPGLLESVYQKCLIKEFKNRGIQYEAELIIPIVYKGENIDAYLRCDFLIEKCIVIETKAIEEFHPSHEAQLLTYMQLLQVPKGILYNFNVANILKQGQKTMVNKLYPAI
jgi:GxxExxY protein